MIRIATPIGNVVQLKYLIHPAEEHKSQQPEQSKEEVVQGQSYATTSMINLRPCPRNNITSQLNGASPIRMAVRSRNMTKETQTIRARPIINQ